jgi:hypothetical protein
MSGIPLHLQRRFEQRWAARFLPPVTSAAPNIASKETVNTSPRPSKLKKPPGLVGGVNQQGGLRT